MNKKHCIPIPQHGNKRTGSGKRQAKNRNQVGLVGHVGIAAEEKSQSTYTPTHTLRATTQKNREEPKIKKTNKTHREYVRGGLKTPSCIKRLLYTLRVDLRLLLHCLFAEENSQRPLQIYMCSAHGQKMRLAASATPWGENTPGKAACSLPANQHHATQCRMGLHNTLTLAPAGSWPSR